MPLLSVGSVHVNFDSAMKSNQSFTNSSNNSSTYNCQNDTNEEQYRALNKDKTTDCEEKAVLHTEQGNPRFIDLALPLPNQ